MKLICDDVNQVYYYIDEEHGNHVSPHFDYEDDAVQWYTNILEYVKNLND